MLQKTITAIEPFALTIIIFAGASLAKWVTFTNGSIIGVATVFIGLVLVLGHVAKQIAPNQSKKG